MASESADIHPRSRQNPVFPGASLGFKGTAALGLKVTDRRTGRPMVITTAMADSPQPGSPIFQPSPEDGGAADDKIGEVARVVSSAQCSATAIWLTGEREVSEVLPDGSPMTGITSPQIGMEVFKYGPTGYSTGAITLLNATVSVNTGGGGTGRISGTFITNKMAELSDAGAIIFEQATRKAVGMIYAVSSAATVAIPIETVLHELDVQLPNVETRTIIEERALEALTAVNDQVGREASDRLGYEAYVNTFVRLVTNPETQPPLTIGIYGDWGSGKTFLMTRIMEKLTGDSTAVVWFNAWEYHASDKLWAGLIQRIFKTVEGYVAWQQRFGLGMKKFKREFRQWQDKLLPLTLAFTACLLLFILILIILGLDKLELVVTLVGITTLLNLAAGLIKYLTPKSEQLVSFFAQPDYSRHLGFMAEIHEDIESMMEVLPDNLKIVIFVDDLDRCEAEKAVEVLEAIKLLLDFNRFFVFLAIDVRIITYAIESHYGEAFREAGITGHEYLQKIIQIPFTIPEPNNDDIRGYLNMLMGVDKDEKGIIEPPQEIFVAQMPDLSASGESNPSATPSESQPAESAPPPQPTFVENRVYQDVFFVRKERDAMRTFIPFMLPNPRRIKRFVNVYRVMRDLAFRRQTDTLTQIEKIITWLLITEQWPYTTCIMMSLLENDTAGQYPDAVTLYQAARKRRTKQTQDADDGLLAQLIYQYGRHLSRQDILDFQPLSINLNLTLCHDLGEIPSEEIQQGWTGTQPFYAG